ncbi:MAG: hypothetical protein AAF978_00915 [Cyanobacteria bacterium P01_E01_bin.48]
MRRSVSGRSPRLISLSADELQSDCSWIDSAPKRTREQCQDLPEATLAIYFTSSNTGLTASQ